MSNVTGEAVKDVSSYMTAIWNNFDGTYDQLEKYADVITALGAATASSSEEIAGGLEQFASIAQTVGLSYEYATSALATVVATTRQSEDVVGTSFKTIFSRLQGLSLGDTLEDGTTLNKYSTALHKVGVEILDASGNMKNLDTILDDLAGKWDTLTTAQKAALAQTVAGTRQYQQLIALMDNWDFMEENLETARNSEGALQEQADIYADSWEAAQKKVKAALQEIYTQLIDDDFFVDLNNGLAKALNLVSKLIDTMGGLPGLLTAAAAAATRLFSKEITSGASNIIFNLANSTKAGKEALSKQREQWNQAMAGMVTKNTNDIVGSATADAYKNQFSIQSAIIEKNKELAAQHKELNEYEQSEVKAILKINNQLGEEYINTAKIVKEQEKKTSRAVLDATAQVNASAKTGTKNQQKNKSRQAQKAVTTMGQAQRLGTQASFASDMSNRFSEINGDLSDDTFEKHKAYLTSYLAAVDQSSVKLDKFKSQLDAIRNASNATELSTAFDEFNRAIEAVDTEFEAALLRMQKAMRNAGMSEEEVNEITENLRTSFIKSGSAAETLASDFNNLRSGGEQASESIKKLGMEGASLQQKFTAGVQALSSFAMALTSIKGIIDTLSDPDLTWFEKFTSVLTTVGFLIPSIISGIESLNLVLGATATAETVAGAAAEGMWTAIAGPVGVIALIVGAVAAITGISSAIGAASKKAEEAKEIIDELNESMKSLSSSGETTQSNISKLKEMSDEYEKLSTKAGEYDRNVDNLTETERSRYNEIKDTIVSLNDEFLGYYNDKGEAILTTNEALKEEIDLLQKEYELKKKEIYTGDNAEKVENAFSTNWESAQSNLEKTKKKQAYAENEGREGYQNQIGTDLSFIEASAYGVEDASSALQGLQSVVSKGTQEIVNSKDKIEEYENQILEALKGKGFSDTEISGVEGYFSNIVHLAEEAEKEVSQAGTDVAKAEQELTSATKIDTSWFVGVLTTDDSKDQGYEALKNAGIEDAEAYLTAYVNGLTLGSEETPNTDAIYENANNFALALANLFSGKDSKFEETLNKAGEEASKVTYDTYQDYITGTFQKINSLIEDNNLGDWVGQNKEAASTLFSKIFGLDNITFSDEGQVDSITTAYTSKINNLKEEIDNLIGEGSDVSRAEITNLIPQDQISNIDSLVAKLQTSELTAENWKDKLNEAANSLKFENAVIAANSVGELTNAMSQAAQANITIDYDSYSTKLLALAGNYDNTTQEVERYNAALKTGNEDQINSANEMLILSTRAGELAANCDIAAEDIEAYAKTLRQTGNYTESTSDALAEMAKDQLRFDEAVNSSVENLEDWNQDLKVAQKTGYLVTDSAEELAAAYGNLLDIDGSRLSATFLESAENLELMQKALEGDEEAYQRLQELAGQEILMTLGLDDSEALRQYQEDLQWIQENSNIDDIAVGVSLDDQSFLDGLTEIVNAAGMTASEATDYLGSMGIDAEVVEDTTSTPTTTTYSGATAKVEWTDMDVATPAYGLLGGTSEATYRVPTITYEPNQVEVPGETQQAAVGLKVTSASKSSGGGIKHSNSTTKNGGSNAKSAKKSSGGGGSSSSKPSRKDTEKHNTDEPDLFHDINEAIKDVEHEVNKLDKAQDHLVGKELINSLKAENTLLEQQSANYTELNRQIEERQTKLKELLSEYGNADDYYTTYNNIQKAYNDAVDSYNALIEAYNAMSKEQQEANDDVIDAAKDELDLRKDAMDKAQKYLEEYYDNKDSLRSNDEKKQELLYQQIENNLEAYTTEIQLELDTTDAERTLAKFLKSVNTDLKNLYKTASEWAEEFTKNSVNATTHAADTQTHLDQLEYYKDIYDNGQWGSSDDLFASESETIQAIVDAQKQVIEDGEALLDDYQDAYDDLKDALEEAVNQFDDIIDDFDRINDTLDHYQKVNELLYGDSATGLQNNDSYYAAAAQDSLARQNALNQYINALKERRAEALAAGYDEDDDYIKNIDDEINDKTSDLESSIESYISTIQSQLENSINMAKNVMDNAMWGGDVSDVQQEWDDKKAMAEGYYDEVEKIYQLESLESKWQSAINSASSLKTQQQLKSLMEGQVAALENKTALSEKDVELAEKEIEVYQAQIALEEAQNSKNSMKLTRDESGNWSYQYVADEDDVADKQQDYIDKLNEWRTAAMEATESIKESILSSYTEFSERMVEIMNDVTLSDEERTQKMAELNETYYGDDGIITKAIEDSNYTQQQTNKATFEELWGLYQNDTEYYEQMTETEKELVDSLRDQGISDYTNLRDFLIGEDGTSGVYGDILDTAQSVNKDCSEAWDSMAADAISQMYGKDGKMDKSSVAGIVQTAYDSMISALGRYDQAIVKSEKVSGIEWSKVDSQLEDTTESIDDVTDHVQGVIDKIADLSEFEEAVLQIKAAWDEVALSVQEAISDLEYYLALLNGGSSSNSSDSDDESIEDATSEISNDSSSTSADSSNSSSSGSGDGELSVGDTATLSGSYYYDSTGTAPAGSKYSGVENGVVVDKINGKYGDYSYHIHSADGAYTDLGWVKKSQLSGYDTGGYTGDWNGGDGRLALLHSKELVLNSSDTSNILNAVSAIRSIASMGDITSTIASGVASLVKNMLGFNSNASGVYGSDSNTEISNGNVFNISAEFPNANNADEIREAIMSLPTLASQYLSRNGR